MTTILVLAVGGSSAPLVSAIATYAPDYVAFLASRDQPGRPGSGSYPTVDGPGEPCDVRPAVRCPACKAVVTPAHAQPSIVARSGLAAGQYEVQLVEADDLSDAYTQARGLLANLRQRFPDARLIVDYTGATKSMSAALVLAALERGDCELAVMLGQRSNLVRVDDGTELATAVNTLGWRAQRHMAMAAELFDQYEYRAAQATLEELARNVALPPDLRGDVQRRVQLCRGFDAWDRFDHGPAFRFLETFASALGQHWQTLLALNGKGKASGYEAVFDLLRNAERRAARARYDDATARLYRAAELLAQCRLSTQHALSTSDLALDRLPEGLRPVYAAKASDDGKVRLGLQEAYGLLQELDDPLGAAFAQVRGPLANALKSRNASILAHGLQPVREDEYQQLYGQLRTLLDLARPILRLGREPAQLPPMREVLP